MAHSRRAHGAFFNEMRLQRAMRAMALRASSAPLMRQTVHPGSCDEELSCGTLLIKPKINNAAQGRFNGF